MASIACTPTSFSTTFTTTTSGRTQNPAVDASLLPTPQSLSPLPSSSIASYPFVKKTHKALGLLDILLHFDPFLTLHDLFICTLVSSTWYKAFNPLLWRTIAISESRHEADFLTNLNRNMRWVHSLQWNYTEWWELHHVSRERLITAPPPLQSPSVSSTAFQQATPPQRSNTVDIAVVENAAQSRAHAQQHVCRSPPPSEPLLSSKLATKTAMGAEASETIRRCSYAGRPVYNAPTPISFPTTAALQALGFENACALQSLVLDGPFELIPLLTTLGRSLPETKQSLQRLSLKNTNCIRREVLPMDLLLRVSPWLEHCSIRTNAQIQTKAAMPRTGFGSDSGSPTQIKHDFPHDYDDDARGLGDTRITTILRQSSPLPRLKSLELDIRAMTGVQLMEILVQCPNLESLAITDYGQISPLQDFRDNDCTVPSQQLHTTANPTYNNLDHLVNVLPTFPHRDVDSVRLSDVALTFLTLHPHYCHQLITLDLTQSHTGKIQSRTLQTFLRSAIGLKHLRTKGGVALLVEDMIDPLTQTWVPWACTGLETLSIAFGVTGSALPLCDHINVDHSLQSSGDAISLASSKNARAEWLVYRQLSLLTQLCVLDIRQSFLRLQVGTGIELLDSLTQLCEFSIAGSEVGQVGISADMNLWFKQNWPLIDMIVIGSRASRMSANGPTPAIGVYGERRRSC
ncbi:hypothetical protein BGZ65_002516 [Modicella reniformis]|uniref:F-box domain-containing protein n=1 Tax=Modicella reniformis TaxID=1440133 RepID=A0A9P6M9J2_9FUNG|nr:hypothetical protein BGZ65_002516 [Modicella reniformis]